MKLKHANITIFNLDHPGACDPLYRKRRERIASKAEAFLKDKKIQKIKYTSRELHTWNTVLRTLEELHIKNASSIYLANKNKLGISMGKIPQLFEINKVLQNTTGFRLEPVAGLVDARSFLSALGRSTMLCTQYMRHHSRPDYTPEPDIIHELVGHAPLFLDVNFALFSKVLGKAAQKANERQLKELERLYWFTVEFGLLREKREIKAFGAGLLSSFGELKNAFTKKIQIKPFDIDRIIQTPYTYSNMQPTLFVGTSFRVLQQKTEEYLKKQKLN